MKLFFIFFVVPCLLISCRTKNASDSKATKQDSIFLHQIGKEKKIIGELGFPMGTILKVNVSIQNGDILDKKGLMGAYILKVSKVNGKPLQNPVLMEFVDETGKLPSDSFGLYELLEGKKAGSLSAEQQEEINKQYVNKIFDLIVYETAGFRGSPANYREYAEIKDDYAYHFSNHLIIINSETVTK